ncbi:MAG: hypothetical protein K2P94_19075 [Rhodospirillaceae bacterium]|nr:hypothetical protein [Rhodospirillaceae bacterium]
MRASYFLWGALAIGVGVSLFLVKYKVQALEDELHARQAQVTRDRGAIRVLQAEWTYLNDPERLRRLSAEHLGFGQATQQNVATIDALPFRAGVDVPAQVSQPTPPAPRAPQTSASIEAGKLSAPERVGHVIFTRIQRLLFSATAGAATPTKEVAR